MAFSDIKGRHTSFVLYLSSCHIEHALSWFSVQWPIKCIHQFICIKYLICIYKHILCVLLFLIFCFPNRQKSSNQKWKSKLFLFILVPCCMIQILGLYKQCFACVLLDTQHRRVPSFIYIYLIETKLLFYNHYICGYISPSPRHYIFQAIPSYEMRLTLLVDWILEKYFL